MAYYRLYHLNRSSGHIDRVEIVEAEDDVRAVAIVKARDRDVAVELWQEGRKHAAGRTRAYFRARRTAQVPDRSLGLVSLASLAGDRTLAPLSFPHF